MRRTLKFLFLPVLAIGLFVYVYQSSLSPKLGLDLQGGISVILTADQDTDPEVLEKSVEIMRTRIEAFGDVQEPEISISGNNAVLVQLPGVTDQERAIEALGATGLLTFRPVLASSFDTGYSPAFEYLPNPDDPENPIKVSAPGVDEEIGISLDDNPNSESYLLSITSSYPVIYKLGPAVLTGNDIEDAIAAYPENEWIVSLEFKDSSAVKFTDLTKQLARETGDKRRLAIVLDGEIVSAPGIALDVNPDIGITGGTAAISMGNTDTGESANNLAVILRYGALPVSFERSSIQKVSASLGEDTLNLGLQAGLIGLIIISIIIILYYRFLGLAADSYIVTFEKLKDEIKVGRSFEFAANKAVDESWKTILTADFVSLSAAFLLYILAVGPIRGFALALGIATIFDLLFTRLYTRNVVPIVVSRIKNTRFLFPIKNKDITNV